MLPSVLAWVHGARVVGSVGMRVDTMSVPFCLSFSPSPSPSPSPSLSPDRSVSISISLVGADVRVVLSPGHGARPVHQKHLRHDEVDPDKLVVNKEFSLSRAARRPDHGDERDHEQQPDVVSPQS